MADTGIKTIVNTNLKLKSGGGVVNDATDGLSVDYSILLNAGETIDGATLPVPVYMDYSDGEVYKCDGNVLTKLEFIGFATSNSTDGNPINVQTSGIVSGFSGLTTGSYYFLSDTVGTIQTTPGTYRMWVATAVSATEIIIIKPIQCVASDDAMGSSAANIGTNLTTSYEKIGEIQLNDVGGVIRTTFSLTEVSNGTTYGRIYKNGVAHGTERSTTEEGPTAFTEDLVFERGDLIQLYAKNTNSQRGAGTFSIKYAKRLSAIPPTVVT
jgi:hypothetical protein